MVTPDGKVIEAGDTNYAFAIESIAKVFTLSLVMSEVRTGCGEAEARRECHGTAVQFRDCA